MSENPHTTFPADAEYFAERVRDSEPLRAFLSDGGGDGDVILTRAPGRLDVMGGVADYSGSLVAEATIGEAALVALRRREDDLVRVWSLDAAGEGWTPTVTVPLSSFYENGKLLPFDAVRSQLTADPLTRWAAYVVGCWYVLLAENAIDAFPCGANVVALSNVPLGAGVSSSAALEVAAMQAVSVAYGLDLDGVTLARYAQTVENRVVGAPCGIMDQMASALGVQNALLLILCQPHTVQGTQGWPAGVRFYGINSNVKHSVGGGAYTRARVAAFMGRKLLGVDYLADMNFNRYPEYNNSEDWPVPHTITGADFLARYGETGDPVTRIDPAVTYPVYDAVFHAVTEHLRVIVLRDTMGQTVYPSLVDTLREAGETMYEAHDSYTRIGLGSVETDLLVTLARDAGPEHGIYGAKITGGGSGGTVAFLTCGDAADATIHDIAARYQEQTGLTPHVMEAGLSPGALAFGHRVVGLHSTPASEDPLTPNNGGTRPGLTPPGGGAGTSPAPPLLGAGGSPNL